jgi:carboxyl-terminal processing protease
MTRFYPNARGSRSILSFVLILGMGLFIGWKSAIYTFREELKNSGALATETAQTEPINLDLFWEVYHRLEQNYVDPTALDTENELYGAIKGMVNALGDPYSVFMSPEETQEFQASLGGTLQGIGAELSMKDGNLVVVAPLKGSPAEKAGLKTGDVIYKIDELFVDDLTLWDAIRAIRGEPETTVTLTIFRKGTDNSFQLPIQRAEINVPSVELKFYGENENIAYLSIYQFGDKTEAEFDAAVRELLLKPVDGIVLDLRDNGGGFLDTSVNILSDFIEGKQKAVVTKHRDEKKNEIYYTNESARIATIPLVVLVNKGSASASEIFAGAIQDYKRGIVMGTQTFGKGSVQVVEVLNDGSSLRMTIAKWYTPKDRSINDVGITPDIVVELTEEQMTNEQDPQLEAALTYLLELK